MTIRLLCDARGTHRKAFMDRTVALSKGKVEVALHFGDRDADYHAPGFQRLEVRPGQKGYLLDTYRSTGANWQLIGSSTYRQMVETAIDQFHRTAPGYQYRTHNLPNLQDYLDYYHMLSDAMAQSISQSGATHALFYNIPHLGYDTVLYQVAQSLGLRVVVLCQTIFPSKYFSLQRIEDMGSFDPTRSDAPPMVIEKGSEPQLFYMDDRWQRAAPRGKLTAAAVGSMLTYLARRAPGKLVNPLYMARTIRRMRGIYGALPDWRDPFARFFHENELAYFEHLAEYEGKLVDLTGKFIYVPLHNQPEMSTSALGGVWRDQVLMIETLARHLPDSWRILVKENPRQGAYARGPMFFHRLNRIAGVQLVPSDVSTHDLSTHAQFVATVTGTAGWEAIRKGRPALVFGNAWYKSLPGVQTFFEGMDFTAVAAATHDHTTLEHDAGALVGRSHDGVIEQVYLANTSSYDPDQNTASVAQTTLDLLTGQVPFTFGQDRTMVSSPLAAQS